MSNFLIIVFLLIGWTASTTIAFAERKRSSASEEKRSTKKKKKMPEPVAEPEEVETHNEKPVDENEGSSDLFPDWPPPGFGWGIQPIVGFRYTTLNLPNQTTRTTTLEYGLAGGLQGIPLAPGNPGLYLEPSAGYVWGKIDQLDVVDTAATTRHIGYQRYWVNSDFLGYYKFYRHTLNLGGGVKTFEKPDLYPPLNERHVGNDFGFLVKPWLSLHLTHLYSRVFESNFSEPFYNLQDLWLHLRFFTSVLDFAMDFGPGSSFVDEFATIASEYQKVANGRTDYLLMIVSANPIWKIGLNATAKYVYHSTSTALGAYSGLSLPNQGLYDIPETSQPENSLAVASFFGISNLFAGFGVGWHYNVFMTQFTDDETRTFQRNQGFGISYRAEF